MPRSLLLLVLSGVLGLAACAPAENPRDQVGVAVRIEKVRAHLFAAAEDAAAGRWDLAATHAAHPAEDLQAIDSALSRKDSRADAALRAELMAVRDAAAAQDARIAETAAAADRSLASAERLIAGAAADAEPFRAAVASELLELSTTEYSEAVVDGKLRAESEYQDAYAFLTRAHALAPSVDAALLAALPGITPPSSLVAPDAYEALVDEQKDALARVSGTAYARAKTTDLAPLATSLDSAWTALGAGDASAAANALTTFRGEWTQVEAFVKARSGDAYARVENDTAAANAALAARPADIDSARSAVGDMRAQLAPFVAAPAAYGVFDAAIILLREGLEALLIVAALLAFLTKTGNAAKRGWIWGGSAAGIAASVVIAIVITVAFSASEAAGADREILEGVTGLFAAAMLVYMSFWLHSKSNMDGWQRYIKAKGGAALARNSLLGLGTIAFLAVFREGAETALFYVGIAPSIAIGDLALGLGLGALGLAVVGVAVLLFGVRIPIRPFFLGTSVLVYYLALKFLGAGVHALQVAGTIPATPRPYLPDIGLIGAFPTVETTVLQALLLGGGLVWLVSRRKATARPQTV